MRGTGKKFIIVLLVNRDKGQTPILINNSDTFSGTTYRI